MAYDDPQSAGNSPRTSSSLGVGRILLSIGFGCLMYGLGLCLMNISSGGAVSNAGKSFEEMYLPIGPFCMAVGGLILGAFIPLHARPQ